MNQFACFKFRISLEQNYLDIREIKPSFRVVLENTTQKYKYPRKFIKIVHFHLAILRWVSNVLSIMGLSSSKPFQIFLSDIFEKVRCYSACCGGQVIVEGSCELEESTDKESQEYRGEDFGIVD